MQEKKTTNPHENEIISFKDEEKLSQQSWELIEGFAHGAYGETTANKIIRGLKVHATSPVSMGVRITAGLGLFQDNTVLYSHTDVNAVIADGGPSPRIDSILIQTDIVTVDTEQRSFIDRAQKTESNKNVPTRKSIKIKAQVVQGSPNPTTTPVGWIKIAEVEISSGLTQGIVEANIKPITASLDGEFNTAWKGPDKNATFRVGTIYEDKKRLRENHLENGDHKNDSIKSRHLDYGSGAEQISATDLPLGLDINFINNAVLTKFNRSDIQLLSQLLNDMPAITALLSPNWILDTDYSVGDIKIFNGVQYYCKTIHKSSNTNKPDIANAPWIKLELWYRDKAYPVGCIYFNKTNKTNPAALPDPLPGIWQALPPDYFIGMQGAKYTLNTLYEDGLPNITGYVGDTGHGYRTASQSGALTRSRYNISAGAGGNSRQANSIYLDASRSSAIYGKATHVQPKTLGVAGFVKTAMAY